VSLYERYKGRVQFVIIDLDKQRSAAQQELVRKYYKGFIPHIVVLDAKGNAVYNQAGESGESEISRVLDGLLIGPSK
jgi:thioredoxin-like negative regulator of GroEL